MGCGGSKSDTISVIETKGHDNTTKTPSTVLTVSRDVSAKSNESHDSGLGGEDNAHAHVDHPHAHIITEHSSEEARRKVEEDFEEDDDIDLSIAGGVPPRNLSAKDKSRVEETEILGKLRDEGLITRPMSRATGGLSFEVIEEGGQKKVIPPHRLEKLELKRKKKKRLTAAELQARLEKEEKRQKEREESLKAHILKQVDNNMNEDEAVTKALQQTREVLAEENREKHLQELRDKLKEKQARIEEARERKLRNPLPPLTHKSMEAEMDEYRKTMGTAMAMIGED